MNDAREPAQHADGGFKSMKDQRGGLLFLEWVMNGLGSMGRTSQRQIKERTKMFEE